MRNRKLETVTVSLVLPVSASLDGYLRALEIARDSYTDEKAKRALAAVAALASRGLVVSLASALEPKGSNARSE